MVLAGDAWSTFGALLKRYRLAARLSQEALAERAGLSARAIRALERGERTAPYHDTVALLGTALKLTPAQRTQLEGAIIRPRGTIRSALTGAGGGSRPLPVALTSFVGREQEIGELCALFAQPTVRLVTLTGPGGVGKTRLALRVADELMNDYADGVRLVELATLTDPALVPAAVAAAFGVRQVADRSLLDQLATVQRSQQPLLVLDNCEHLADACAQLLDGLLRDCPRLQVLATSRQTLRVDGEHNYPVRSLSVPPADLRPSLDELASYAAVRLFDARARLVQPDFALTARNAQAVSELCRQLDGIPLALEFAAARLQALGIEQLAQRLDQRFRLLAGGSRAALPRQQTLRATLDWSYDLLDEQERMLFRRLSIFVGGFTLEAAEAVCLGNGLAPDEVLDVLARLVAQSLVVLEARQEGSARYRLLETVRQYARERLGDGEEAKIARDRHAAYFARAAADLRTFHAEVLVRTLYSLLPSEAAARRLEPDFDNLRLALEWLVAGQATEQIVPVLAVLQSMWRRRGAGSEGLRYCRTVLALPRFSTYTIERGVLLYLAGHLAYVTGAYAEARGYREEQVAALRPLGDSYDLAVSLGVLGMIVRELGEFATAQSLIEEGMTMHGRLGVSSFPGVLYILLGEVLHVRGERAQAKRYYEEGLRAAPRQQDSSQAARALHHLGALALDQDEFALARARFAESVALHCQRDDRNWYQYALADCAELAAAEGQAERALRLGAAATVWEAHGHAIQPSERGRFERWMDTARSALSEEAAKAAWAEGEAMSLDQALACAQGDGCRAFFLRAWPSGPRVRAGRRH